MVDLGIPLRRRDPESEPGPPFDDDENSLRVEMEDAIRNLHGRIQLLEPLSVDDKAHAQEEWNRIWEVIGDDADRVHEYTKRYIDSRRKQDVGGFFHHRGHAQGMETTTRGLGGTHPVECPPVRPELNYVDWDKFRTCSGQRDRFAIDVLGAEPQVTSRREGSETRQAEQAPLPERIRINSKPIMKVLGKICPSGLSPLDRPMILLRPFRILSYYEWEIRDWHSRLERDSSQETNHTSHNYADKTATQEETEDDGTARPPTVLDDLRCLVQFIDAHLRPRQDYLMSPHGRRVTFSDLWLVFKPGDYVVDQEKRQGYRVVGLSTAERAARGLDRESTEVKDLPAVPGDDSVIIECVYIDFDGLQLGPVTQKFVLPRFYGERDITTLAVCPRRFGVEPREDEALIERGKTFAQVLAIRPMRHTGRTLDRGLEVDGTVIIDFEEAFRSEQCGAWKPAIKSLHEDGQDIDRMPELSDDIRSLKTNGVIHSDEYVAAKSRNDFSMRF